MAEGTPLAQNRAEIAALQRSQMETSSKLAETQGRLGNMEVSLKNIEGLLKEALKMKTPVYDSSSHSGGNRDEPFNSHTPDMGSTWPKGMKVDLPMFDGDRVEEWVFRVRQYFEVYDVPKEWRIRMISFHLMGPAYT